MNCAALDRVNQISIADGSGSVINELLAREFLEAKPNEQIDIIKNRIIELLPKASFISGQYSSPLKLTPDDYVELFISHQLISMDKVNELIE